MTSLARIAANRANARKSTGPKTAAGKARAARNGRNSKGPRTAGGKRAAAANSKKSTGPKTEAGKKQAAQNARRHGLTLLASCEPDAQATIGDFAQAITKQTGQPLASSAALRIASGQFDLLRVRGARARLLAAPSSSLIRRLAALERYEARARRQRKVAMRDLQEALSAASEPPQTVKTNRTKPKSDKTE
jgi:hypothetical protein